MKLCKRGKLKNGKMKNIHFGGQNKKTKNQFFFRVGTVFVMSEDALTIEYNERALTFLVEEFLT